MNLFRYEVKVLMDPDAPFLFFIFSKQLKNNFHKLDEAIRLNCPLSQQYCTVYALEHLSHSHTQSYSTVLGACVAVGVKMATGNLGIIGV